MAVAIMDQITNDTLSRAIAGHSDLYEDPSLKGSHSVPLLERLIGGDPTTTILTGTTTTTLRPSLLDVDLSDGQIDDMLKDLVEMNRYEKTFWSLLFFIMVLVAAGGNIIVIYIVSTNKEMKSVTNYFLVNLSLADTMVSTLNVIFNFISMLDSHWPFGLVYCKISNFIAILSISASVFTLTAISCDRYHAIIYPLRPRMSHRHAIGWILLIWTFSSLLALPNAICSTLFEDSLISNKSATTCTMVWPDGRYPTSSWDHIYNILILVITYLFPILTMAILYYRVGKELWGYEAIGENIEKQRRAIMAKKKIVKMMIVVVIIFALCWLPYHAFFVINYYLPTIFQDAPLIYQRLYLIMYWLAMSNSMYNPIIIYFMNSKFRHEFRRVLCFICCSGRRYVPPTGNRSIDATANNNKSINASVDNNLNNSNHQLQNQQNGSEGGGGNNVTGSYHHLSTKRYHVSPSQSDIMSNRSLNLTDSNPSHMMSTAAAAAAQVTAGQSSRLKSNNCNSGSNLGDSIRVLMSHSEPHVEENRHDYGRNISDDDDDNDNDNQDNQIDQGYPKREEQVDVEAINGDFALQESEPFISTSPSMATAILASSDIYCDLNSLGNGSGGSSQGNIKRPADKLIDFASGNNNKRCNHEISINGASGGSASNHKDQDKFGIDDSVWI